MASCSCQPSAALADQHPEERICCGLTLAEFYTLVSMSSMVETLFIPRKLTAVTPEPLSALNAAYTGTTLRYRLTAAGSISLMGFRQTILMSGELLLKGANRSESPVIMAVFPTPRS